MADQDHHRLEDVLALARQMASRLDAVGKDVSGAEAFALRLALAHALGIVDQVSDMIVERESRPPMPTPTHKLEREDELVH